MKSILMAIALVLIASSVSLACNRCGNNRCNNCFVNHNNNVVHHNNNFEFRNNALVIPIQVIRLVEVPGLELVENVVVVRDHNGNVVDVRRQVTYDLNSQVRRDKVIIQINEDVFRGHNFNY